MGGWIILALVVALAYFAIVIYNRLVALRNRYKNAFAQIDVQLKRRYDLIPNLVEAAKGYLAHERQTLEAVIAARGAAVTAAERAAQAPGEPAAMTGLAQAEVVLGGALGRLLAVFENFPDLKANQNVLQVQEELTSTIPAGWFQSLNPVFVLVLAPLFASLWVALAARDRDPPTPAKFAIGLLLLAAGFAVMYGAAGLVAAGNQVLPTRLVATYLLHTMGEMALAPVGLSATTKLAPHRFRGQMMGVWFLGLAVGNLAGGLVAGRFRHDALEDMPGLYTQIVLTAVVAGVLMLLLARPIRRLMGRSAGRCARAARPNGRFGNERACTPSDILGLRRTRRGARSAAGTGSCDADSWSPSSSYALPAGPLSFSERRVDREGRKHP